MLSLEKRSQVLRNNSKDYTSEMLKAIRTLWHPLPPMNGNYGTNYLKNSDKRNTHLRDVNFI